MFLFAMAHAGEPAEEVRDDRIEVAVHAGFVADDPYLRQKLVGAAVGYSVGDLVAVTLSGTVSPSLGESDLKLQKQILRYVIGEEGPDVAWMRSYATLDLRFSPISGAVEAGRAVVPFALYGLVGTGLVRTRDDLLFMMTDAPAAVATETQLHPLLHVGGGLQLGVGRTLALRLEVADVSYVEVFESVRLDVKRHFTPLVAVANRFPVPG